MDSCFATLKANVHPVKVCRGVGNTGTGFWGESIGVSLKGRDLSAQFLKSSESERRRVNKVKPGVPFSVLTPDINKEVVVSEFRATSVKSDLS